MRQIPKRHYEISAMLFSLVGVVASVAGLFVTSRDSRPTEYRSQIESLDKTKASIQSLLTFIDVQKKQVQTSQQAVEALKNEETLLHPLVTADRQVIDAMFAVQEGRNQASQARERWIGFGLGVTASLMASILYAVTSNIVRRRRQEPSPAPSA